MNLNIDNQQGIELFHFIFEREFMPPFRKVQKNTHGYIKYYNRNDKYVGWLYSDGDLSVDKILWGEIKYKVCIAFGYSCDTLEWLYAIKPHLKSWMEDQINIELKDIY